MCTVTVVPAPPGRSARGWPLARLVCNRDEQRTRAPSSSLRLKRVTDRLAALPIDPPSGGSWVGANDAGLVACLLNANAPCPPGARPSSAGRSSRGLIVPALLSAESLDDAAGLAREIDPTRFPPFRLLVLCEDQYFIAHSDARSSTFDEPTPLVAPLMLTSSGLGDHLVETVRRELFDRIWAVTPDAFHAQARFHSHRWPERPHLSVLMSRPDARTVSRTVVDLRADAIELSHARLDDALKPVGSPSRLCLSLARAEIAA